MSNKMTWQQFSEENEFDFEEAYQRRLGGESWKKLTIPGTRDRTIKILLKQYCEEMGRDFGILEKVDASKLYIIDDANMVDRGKVMALWKAGWPVYEIAVDCHCTKECVNDVLRGKGKR